jgi:hypothetical protein
MSHTCGSSTGACIWAFEARNWPEELRHGQRDARRPDETGDIPIRKACHAQCQQPAAALSVGENLKNNDQ